MAFDTSLADGTVRVATEDDVDAVERLWTGYSDLLAEHDDRYELAEGGRERWRKYFQTSLVDSSRGDVLLAERDGEAAGVVEVRVTGGHPVFEFGRHGQVYGHFVDPAHRRQGVGTALLEAAEDWFRDQEMDFYRVEVLDATGAAGLYEEFGLERVESAFEGSL
jgi:GNAT superfamily N-acetyltransferase